MYVCVGGLLKIEDVLPFFPDFVTIDNFKEAICDSLERYNKQVGTCAGTLRQTCTFFQCSNVSSQQPIMRPLWAWIVAVYVRLRLGCLAD